MFRLLLKIWPALIPITIYLFWVLVIEKFLLRKILKKNSDIEGEKIVGGKTTEVKKPSLFSLQNPRFVIALYLSLFFAILGLVLTAFSW